MNLSLFSRDSKPLRFACFGATGCLVGAILGELLYAFMPPPPKPPQVDVVFAVDITSSMNFAIAGVRDGIQSFARSLNDNGMDLELGLVGFRDGPNGEPLEWLTFERSYLTQDFVEFQQQVAALRERGGGDTPESAFDALSAAARIPYRDGSQRVLILITDAPPKIPDLEMQSPNAVALLFKTHSVNQLHLVIQPKDAHHYSALQAVSPGAVFSIADAADRKVGFDTLLPKVSESISKTLGSTTSFKSEQSSRVLAIFMGWTSVLAVGVVLALIGAQNLLLRRPFLTVAQGVPAGVGAVVAGALAALPGEILFQLSTASTEEAGLSSLWLLIGRLIGWTILGGVLGGGVSRFVPNLPLLKASLAGALGGGVAALGFMLVSTILLDASGRWTGAAVLGFAIGLMIGIAELAMRSAWLEVHFGPKEITQITLGPEPVSIGSGAGCVVWAPGTPERALHFLVRQGAVVEHDYVNGTDLTVGDQHSRDLGRIRVVVRCSTSDVGGAGAAQPAQRSVVPPPPPNRPVKVGANPVVSASSGPTSASADGGLAAGSEPVVLSNVPAARRVEPPARPPLPPPSATPQKPLIPVPSRPAGVPAMGSHSTSPLPVPNSPRPPLPPSKGPPPPPPRPMSPK